LLRFFPMPYPDETMYSVFGRYDKLTGNNNYYATIKELFGSMYYEINFYFASKLEKLLEEMPSNYPYNINDFIINNTILPIYKPFISNERYSSSIDIMKKGSINLALNKIGYVAGGICRINGIKYCEKCLEEDKLNYGEAYIHRSHQIEGNMVCSKHKAKLKIYETPKIVNGSNFFNIDAIEIDTITENKKNQYQNEFQHLSMEIDFLLNNVDNFLNFESTREKYYSRIYDKGYMSEKGLINQVKLHEDFLKFYDIDFLDVLESGVSIKDENSWLRTIVRRKVKTVHPIRNLLFIRFLFGDLHEHLNYEEHATPILKERIKEAKLKKYKSANYNENFRELYKNSILELMAKEPNISRRKLSKKLNKEYRWLYTHERDWFESVMPKPVSSKECYKNNRINWLKRDEELYIKTKEAINRILDNDVMKKITTTSLSRDIEYKGLINDLDKLPKTKELINTSCEDFSDFHKRKIRIVIKHMNRNGEELKKYLILRNAGISEKYYHDYDDYIEKEISKL